MVTGEEQGAPDPPIPVEHNSFCIGKALYLVYQYFY